ncbi:hypothetical protein BOTBODRAFT_25604 [Botryobasidium botryosum FD-172 SS1]|uniref:Uncharacterized protein n=1 Tax=Botryobasidium botryosum (strain FD-172 SS1) TaxID=930990 RepID=A0A067NBL4_BOTB1|nr:hypothetical protein BOTBODRAFT_25604 [Botryobasidium botryosum FD-172 SS1]
MAVIALPTTDSFSPDFPPFAPHDADVWGATQIQESQDHQPSEADNAWAKFVHLSSGQELFIPHNPDQQVQSFQVGRAYWNGFFNNQTISVTHAKITSLKNEPDRVLLEDVSSNGTIIKNTHVHRSKAYMLDGDIVYFGRTCALNSPLPLPEYSFHMLNNKRIKPRQHGLAADYLIQEAKPLGSGTFATVFKGHDIRSAEPVAIKRIDKHKFGTTMIDRELLIMESLDHPNIVRLKNRYEDDQFVYFVLEFVDGGDLFSKIVEHPRRRLTEEESRHMAYQMCLGLDYAHQKNIAHRDIKPENVLLTKDNPPKIKIADFGLGKLASAQSGLKTQCGTPEYLAPEILLSKKSVEGYDSKVDSYSLGVTVFVMLMGRHPYEPMPAHLNVELLSQRRLPKAELARYHISADAIDFVDKLMCNDPGNRMSIGAALQHRWIRAFQETSNSNSLHPSSSFASFISDATDATANAPITPTELTYSLSRNLSLTARPPFSSGGQSDSTEGYGDGDEFTDPDTPMPGLKSKFSDVSDISSVGTLPGTYPSSMVAVANGSVFGGRTAFGAAAAGRLPVDAEGNEYVPDSQPPHPDDTPMELMDSTTAVDGMDCDEDEPSGRGAKGKGQEREQEQEQGMKRKASSPLSPLPEGYLRKQAAAAAAVAAGGAGVRTRAAAFGLRAGVSPKPSPAQVQSPKKGVRKVTPQSAGRRHSERIKARVNIVGDEPPLSPVGKRRARGRAGAPSS